jgi:hypothetical protein
MSERPEPDPIAERLERERPAPDPDFRADLRRRLFDAADEGGEDPVASGPASPAVALACLAVGALCLFFCALGVLGVGPFAV